MGVALSTMLRERATLAEATSEAAAKAFVHQPLQSKGIRLTDRLGAAVTGQAIVFRGQFNRADVAVKMFYSGKEGKDAYEKERRVMNILARGPRDVDSGASRYLINYLNAVEPPYAIVYPLMAGSLDKVRVST